MTRLGILARLAVVAALSAGCGSNPNEQQPPPPVDGGADRHAHDAAPPKDAPPPPPDAWPASKGTLPELPARTPFDQNVLLVKDQKPTVPVYPAWRASNDERVAISTIVP